MIQSADPAAPFEPDANERDVRRIGDLAIDNHADWITLTGDVVLAREQADWALAQDLRAMIVDVVRALDADAVLPEAVQFFRPKRSEVPHLIRYSTMLP